MLTKDMVPSPGQMWDREFVTVDSDATAGIAIIRHTDDGHELLLERETTPSGRVVWSKVS